MFSTSAPEPFTSEILPTTLGIITCLYLISFAFVMLVKSELRQFKYRKFKEHLPSLKRAAE
jgi:hypothetical protein